LGYEVDIDLPEFTVTLHKISFLRIRNELLTAILCWLPFAKQPAAPEMKNVLLLLRSFRLTMQMISLLHKAIGIPLRSCSMIFSFILDSGRI
jgi:hypothetical protein